jgi:hypothetical protein
LLAKWKKEKPSSIKTSDDENLEYKQTLKELSTRTQIPIWVRYGVWKFDFQSFEIEFGRRYQIEFGNEKNISRRAKITALH